MTTATILSDAADLIEEAGWRQQELGDEFSGFCALGAIRASARLHAPADCVGAIDAISRAISIQGVGLDKPMIRLVRWNDKPERTEGEVVSVLRSAAEAAALLPA